MAYFLGIDIGTTRTKVLVCSSTGQVQSVTSRGYPLLTPAPDRVEQDPEVILQAVLQATQEAIATTHLHPQEIRAIGFSAAMHSLIAVDTQGRPLTHCWIWADRRSLPQAERLRQSEAGMALYHKTGTPLHPLSPLCKLLWMQENDPELFQRADRFISIKEYVLYHWCGQFVVDESIASATGLFNLQTRTWDPGALAWAKIQPDRLSRLVSTTDILQGIHPELAQELGLQPDTPLVVGASDGVLANLGAGVLKPDPLVVTVGTSGAVRQTVPTPFTDSNGQLFCYALTTDYWVVGGATNNGGVIWQWFVEQLMGESGRDGYDRWLERAATVPPGAEGLLFLPLLAGERAPYWNPDARGVFLGLGLHHGPSHLARSVLEGIVFNLYGIATLLPSLSDAPPTVRVSGGLAQSGLWRQILADLFNREVAVPEVGEASGLGAVMLAMYAVGTLENLAQAASFVTLKDFHQPRSPVTRQYRNLFQLYQRVYDQLEQEFGELQKMERSQS